MPTHPTICCKSSWTQGLHDTKTQTSLVSHIVGDQARSKPPEQWTSIPRSIKPHDRPAYRHYQHYSQPVQAGNNTVSRNKLSSYLQTQHNLFRPKTLHWWSDSFFLTATFGGWADIFDGTSLWYEVQRDGLNNLLFDSTPFNSMLPASFWHMADLHDTNNKSHILSSTHSQYLRLKQLRRYP